MNIESIINLLPPSFQGLLRKMFSVLPFPIDNIIIPIIVALLIIWLVYRIQIRIKLIITREFLNNFPSIRRNVDDLESRLEYLNNRVRELEEKLKKHADKTKTPPPNNPTS